MLVINLKVLFFILPLGGMVFWLASKHSKDIVSRREITRWRNLWFFIQTTAFVSPNIWIFYFVVAFSCMFFVPKTPEGRITTYALLLSSLPFLPATIPGGGIIEHFFILNFPRVLTIFLLVPLYFTLKSIVPRAQLRSPQPADKFVILFTLLIALLWLRGDSLTNVVRQLFLMGLDYLIPYFVISRCINSTQFMRKVLLALFISISISAIIGVFETVKDWHIYNHLVNHLLDAKRLHGFDVRGGFLRAAATFMSPIVLGYVITIALGLFLYLSPIINNKNFSRFIFLGLIIALLATVSRGPWVGFAALSIIYVLISPAPLKGISKLAIGLFAFLPILLATDIGQKLIDLLPFIGSIRSDTVDYRSQLFDMSMIVIQRNPLLGSINFMETAEMISMTQGQGIIDIVNTYLRITLTYGYAGLSLFLSIFIVLLIHIHKTIRRAKKEDPDTANMGRMLFSVLCAIMLIIYTVSSIDYIPHYYWLIFALSSAYIRFSQQETSD